MREQTLIDILSTAQTAGIDAAIAAIDKENASLAQFQQTAGSVDVGRLTQSSNQAVQSLQNVGSEASKTGAALDELSEPTHVVVLAEADQAQATVAQMGASLDAIDDPRRVPIDADGASAQQTMNSLKAQADELAQPRTIPFAADTSGAVGPLASLRQSLSDVGGEGSGVGSILSGIGQTALMAKGGVGGLAGGLGGLASAAGPAGLAVAGVTAAAGALGAVSLGAAGEMERYRTQLGVLLGSTDAAQERIEELVDFAATTPFEIPEVVRASKVLQTFGGDALATGESLRLIGDVASGTGTSFEEMALLMGRVKASLESGLVPGDQLLRLQAMGALTVEGREKIMQYAEAVREGNASAGDAFNVLGSQTLLFSGMMEKQSATLEGKFSNLQDAIGGVFRSIGDLMLPVAKAFLDILIPIVSGIGAFIKGLGSAEGEAEGFGKVLQVVQKVVGGIVGVIGDLVGWLGPRLKPALDIVGYTLEHIGTAFGLFADAVSWFIDQVGPPFAAIMGVISGAFDAVQQAVGDFAATLIGVVAQVVEVAAGIPGPWQEAATDVAAHLNQMKADVDGWGEHTVTKLGAAGAEGPEALASGLEAGAPAVDEAAASVFDGIPTEEEKALDAAKEVAKATPYEIAKSLAEGADPVYVAAKLVADQIENAVSPQKEIARLEAIKAGNAVGAGLLSTVKKTKDAAQKQYDAWVKIIEDPTSSPSAKWEAETNKMAADMQVAAASNLPGVKASVAAWTDAIDERLFALKEDVPQYALDTGKNYADALASKHAEVKAAANRLKQEARLGIDPETAKKWGYEVGVNFGLGIQSSQEYIYKSAQIALSKGIKVFRGASPPPLGPFHLIDQYGADVMAEFGKGMVSAGPEVQSYAEKALNKAASVFSGVTGAGQPGYGVPSVVGGGVGAVAGGVMIGAVNVILPESWRGTPQETQDVAEALAREIRLSQVVYATTPIPGAA